MRWKRQPVAKFPLPHSPDDGLRSRWRYLPRLLNLLWGLGPREVALLGIFSVAGGLLPVISLIVLQRMVDSTVMAITLRTSLHPPLCWLAGLFLANLLHAFCDFWENGWLGFGRSVRERIRAQAQARVLTKASRVSLGAFEQPDLYDQLHRAQRGIDTQLLTTLYCLLPIGSDLLVVISLFVYVGSASLLFPLILVLGLVPLSIVHARNLWQRHALERKQTPAERLLQYLGDLMLGRQAAAEIRLFGLGELLLERRQQLFVQLRDARLAQARSHFRASMVSMGGEQLTYGAVVLGVVALIARGSLSVGYFAAYWGAAERFRTSLSSLFWSVTVLDNNLRYIRDLFDYLDTDEELEPQIQGIEALRGERGRALTQRQASEEERAVTSHAVPRVRLERVSFTYPGSDRPVLDRIDLEISPGERVALVGENGAGKTTLAKILLGLHAPTSGRILVNDAELGALDGRRWRSRVAAVFQEYVQYQLTVWENIGFGDLRKLHDADAIQAAANKSGAAEMVLSLPAGYETVLGKAYDERGQDLSIGQWQRLAIARAYLRDAWLLVLDEPTAALDARAEVEVYRQFRDISQGKSVILISHRLGAARLADRIVVLDKGTIVEQGSHARLMAHGGRYAKMYLAQASWYE